MGRVIMMPQRSPPRPGAEPDLLELVDASLELLDEAVGLIRDFRRANLEGHNVDTLLDILVEGYLKAVISNLDIHL